MMTFGQFLTEWPHSISIGHGGSSKLTDELKIHTNPGPEEMQTALDTSWGKKLRGMVDDKGDVHVWDAAHAIHPDVRYSMKIPDPMDSKLKYFYVKGHDRTVAPQPWSDDDELWNNHHLQRATKGFGRSKMDPEDM